MKAVTGWEVLPFTSSLDVASQSSLRMRRRSRFATKFGVFLCLLIAGLAPARAEEKELTALDIFDRALASFDTQRAALREYQYYQTLTTHQFDSTGQVTARGTWQSIVRPGDPRPLEYVGERIDGKLSFFKSESSSASASPASSPSSKSKAPE